jgi:hypothetical protein
VIRVKKIIENTLVYLLFTIFILFFGIPTLIPQFQPYDYLILKWNQLQESRVKTKEQKQEELIRQILLEANLNSKKPSIPMPCIQLMPNIIDCPHQKIECHIVGDLVSCRQK